MTTVAGDAAAWGVEPQRVQWSHTWLGAGLAGRWSGAVSVFPPLWQMTENGSTVISDPRAGVPPHKTVCMVIAVTATMLRSRLKRVGMLSSGRDGGLADYRCNVLR